jgi:hypothetical protein
MANWVWDVLVVAGLALVGAAVYLAFGAAAAAGYAGVVLVVVGVLGAWLRTRQGPQGGRR